MCIIVKLLMIYFQAFGVRTRSRAVSIFNICAGMIATMAELQKASIVRFASGSYRPAHGRTAEGKYCKVG